MGVLPEDTRRVNRARWDELARLHVRSPFYGVDAFRAGGDALDPIVAAEIGQVAGLRLVHLQCHFGLDTLCLARRGAAVTGLDFAPAAIAEARGLAAETGIAARFVESDVYDAPRALGERFDMAFVSWGALNWLPDIAAWARVVADVLAPGGRLYFAEGHPSLYMLEQADAAGPIVPTYDYFQGAAPLVSHSDRSYSGDPDTLANTTMHEWIHPLGAVVTALIAAGLTLEWLHEHAALPWQGLPCMVGGDDGLYRLPPDHPRLPLAYSLSARAPDGP
jgi:SAM-dependent methyltransferase